MIGIIGIAASLTVFALSLLVTRLAAVALKLTGLSHEAARFQAKSAFTGTGFTSSETEKVVGHPVRRRIIMMLMNLRSAGLVTIIISLILTFAQEDESLSRLIRLCWLLGGAGLLLLIAHSNRFDRLLSRMISKLLARWTDLDVRDYSELLKLSGDYRVMEIYVSEREWLSGKNLDECNLPDEGVTVLGIYRKDGAYIGAPQAQTEIYEGDTLLLYGRGDALKKLGRRPTDAAGEAEHREAVEEQQKHIAAQEMQEAAYKTRRQAKKTRKRAAAEQRSEPEASENHGSGNNEGSG
jgi:K+/H+ antiporter YhaU regulatory subunit KhtT